MSEDGRPPQTDEDTESGADVELADVLDSCLADIEAGRAVDTERLLAEHPAVASRLRVCLAGLGLVEQEGRALRSGVGNRKPPTAPAPRELGDYRLLREIGRGGMGVVYEAEQISLRRRVALKVLPSVSTLDPRHLHRFQAEARAAASLQHPHIVPVHAVGSDQGVYYYAMQLIEGRSLAALLEDLRRPDGGSTADREAPTQRMHRSLPLFCPGSTGPIPVPRIRELIELGAQAAEALEYAHQMGVVHRDVKPGNLLVDRQDRLWVADFGLALFAADQRLTQTGDVIGTLRYMSPEQARAQRGLVDHRTDVYALGATLYELLTLRPLFDGGDAHTLLTQIAFQEPVPPRRLNRAIAPELEVILLKAVAKQVEERYATAHDLADDLRNFLEDRPIRARPPTQSQRLARWARRHRQLVRAGLLLLVLAVLGLGAAVGLIWQEKEKTEAANLKLEHLLTVQTQTAEREQRNASRYCIAAAQSAWETNRMGKVAELLGECALETRRWEWHYLDRQCHKHLLTLQGPSGLGLGMSLSPDGRLLAIGGYEKAVVIWDAESGREVLRLAELPDPVGAVAFSPDSATLAVFDTAGRVQLRRAVGGEVVGELRAPPAVLPVLAWHPDGRRLVTASGPAVIVWDVSRRARERELGLAPQNCVAVALAKSGERTVLAVRTGEGLLKVWDAGTWETVLVSRYAGWAHGLAFSRDGRLIAIPHDTAVDVVALPGGQLLRSLSGSHQGVITGVAFRGDGLLATACNDGAVRLWDPETGVCLRRYRGHTGQVVRVTFSPDGSRLYSCNYDLTVKVWNAEKEQECQLLPGHTEGVWTLAFSPEGKWLAAGALDGRVYLLSTPDGRPQKTLFPQGGVLRGLVFLDGGRLALLGRDGSVTMWDVEKAEQLSRLPLDGEAVSLTSDGDRRFLVVTTFRGVDHGLGRTDVRIWDVVREAVVATLPGPTRPVASGKDWFDVAVRPDGKLLAWQERDGITLRETMTGREVLHCRGARPYARAAFSPDGAFLAATTSTGSFNDACVWDAIPGQAPEERPPVRTLRGHTASLTRLAFSPTGRRLATASSDFTLRLWDVETGWEVLTLAREGPWMECVAFSPDGNLLAAGARLWDATPGPSLLVEGPR